MESIGTSRQRVGTRIESTERIGKSMEKTGTSRQRVGTYPIFLGTVMSPVDQRAGLSTGLPSSITSTSLEPHPSPSPESLLRLMLRGRQPVHDLPPPPPEHQHDHGQRHWADLPPDALTVIFHKLGEPDVRIFAGPVCRSWWHLATHPAGPYLRCIEGRCIDMRRLPYSLWLVADTDKLCRQAFRHTDGQIDKLYAVNVSNNLLPYIADRSPYIPLIIFLPISLTFVFIAVSMFHSVGNLKFLSLIKSNNISAERLHDFLLRHCPLLEELRLYFCLFYTPKNGQLGQACPNLKRLWIDGTYLSDHEINEEPEYRRFKKSRRYHGYYGLFRSDSSDCESDNDSDSDSDDPLSPDDRLACEIANNMPQLRHLQLIRSTRLTRKGVNAVLDKCLFLESLDLRCCFRLRVDRALHNRLLKMKSVRLSRCSQFRQS